MRLIFFFLVLFNSGVAFSQTLQLPVRLPGALNGSQVISMLTPLSLTAREDSIFAQVVSGNVPDFLRSMVMVSDTEVINTVATTIQYYVIPDYLALGCDTDYFLCPMTPLLAQRIANYTGTSMPTRKMVNQIWQQAPCHLSPQSISPSPQMTTVPVFADHNAMVWISRSAQMATHPLGTLTGGDKKDVVISNIIYGYPSPGRVVIYGWHYLSGTPIQPLYNGHEETYADYSHGIRLVQNSVLVNGSATTIQDVLASSSQNVLLSDEGVISVPTYPFSIPSLSVPKSFCALDSASGIIKIIVKHDALVAGYNVMLSHDGLSFQTPQYFSGNSFAITGLTPDTLIYLKISAVGIAGGNSLYSEVLAATTFAMDIYDYPWLIINGFDRATTGNTYNFIRQHASAIFQNTSVLRYISSSTNEAVCDSLFLLDDIFAIDYILGEESSANETFSDEEQQIIAAYMDQYKPLFVSGSEIGWDLDYLGSVSDKAFYNNYLRASYVEDAPNNLASTYYQFTIPYLATFSFDDGTNGTYDVRYPDVVQKYPLPLTDNAGYFTGFSSKYVGTTSHYLLVYLTVPFETIYPESDRISIMNWVAQTFFMMESADNTSGEEIKIFPNPCNGTFTVGLPSGSPDAIYTITDISGKKVEFRSDRISDKSLRFSIADNGMYFLTIIADGIKVTHKIIVIK